MSKENIWKIVKTTVVGFLVLFEVVVVIVGVSLFFIYVPYVGTAALILLGLLIFLYLCYVTGKDIL